jgi:hypothetical protein
MKKVKRGVILEGNLEDVVKVLAKALKVSTIGTEPDIGQILQVCHEIINETAKRLEYASTNLGALVLFAKESGFEALEGKTDQEINKLIKQAMREFGNPNEINEKDSLFDYDAASPTCKGEYH